MNGENDIRHRVFVLEEMAGKLAKVPEMVADMHVALIGDIKNPEKPGAIQRIVTLEAWRKSTSTRVKNRAALLWASFGSLTVGVLLVVIKIIVGGK